MSKTTTPIDWGKIFWDIDISDLDPEQVFVVNNKLSRGIINLFDVRWSSLGPMSSGKIIFPICSGYSNPRQLQGFGVFGSNPQPLRMRTQDVGLFSADAKEVEALEHPLFYGTGIVDGERSTVMVPNPVYVWTLTQANIPNVVWPVGEITEEHVEAVREVNRRPVWFVPPMLGEAPMLSLAFYRQLSSVCRLKEVHFVPSQSPTTMPEAVKYIAYMIKRSRQS